MPEEVWKKLGLLSTTSDKEQDNDDDDEPSSSSSCEILWQPNPNLSAPVGTERSSSHSTNDENETMQE